jgi:hypothetical protein
VAETPGPPGGLRLEPAVTPLELERYFRFAREVYRGDPNWVAPILGERLAKVDPERNPFWRNAERSLWTALRDGEVVGTIMAVHDRARAAALRRQEGTFGFFECRDDAEAASALVEAASAWLAARGLDAVVGPFNPGPADDMGILVEGFDTRPAVMEAHNPPYYARLLEAAGMRPRREVYARLLVRPPGNHAFLEDAHPRLRRAMEIAERRGPDVVVRSLDRRRWEEDVRSACRLFNAALADVPEHVPVPEVEFLASARELRPFMDDELALVAEAAGRPAGFCLALPDINEALLHARGAMDLSGTLRFLWHRRRIRRLSLKIMAVVPECRDRFVEVLLLRRLGEAAWRKGYREVDLSLTGEENWRSNRIQEKTGARIYRRYRIYGRTTAGGRREEGGRS